MFRARARIVLCANHLFPQFQVSHNTTSTCDGPKILNRQTDLKYYQIHYITTCCFSRYVITLVHILQKSFLKQQKQSNILDMYESYQRCLEIHERCKLPNVYPHTSPTPYHNNVNPHFKIKGVISTGQTRLRFGSVWFRSVHFG